MTQSDNLPIDDQDRADDPAAEQSPPVCLFGPGGDFTKEWPPRTRAAGATASQDYNAVMKATGPLLRAIVVTANRVRAAQQRSCQIREPGDRTRLTVLEQDLDRGLVAVFGQSPTFREDGR